MQVNTMICAKGRFTGMFFDLQVTSGLGWPSQAPLTVYSEIDFEPDEVPGVSSLYVRLIDPDANEVGRSEVQIREVAIREFDGHGFVAHLAGLSPNYPSKGIYLIELVLNGEVINSRHFQVGE